MKLDHTDTAQQQSRVQRDQSLRLKRLAMASASYSMTAMVIFCSAMLGLLPWSLAFGFAAAAVVINLTYLVLFKTGTNLRFKDPSLTASQMLVSIVPALVVMYFYESGQARGAVMVLGIVPVLFGVLALNTRQLLMLGGLFAVCYGVLMAFVAAWRPESLRPSLELLQGFVLVVVMLQIGIIGGYISGMREKLRERNAALQQALVQINDMANRDMLTGLFNRRHLFDVLLREVNRERRAKNHFSVCILDVDHFKQVNDEYGHQAGDLVLKRIAEVVPKTLRNIDCFGRYGGEEFLLVLPQTNLEGALIKAERVRELIAGLSFPEIDENFRVTVSLGVAQYRLEEPAEQTIARADHALYSAKAQGRNCCEGEAA